jgi:hypothetical protein
MPQVNYTKIIVCLANSRKNSGRCIAGKEIEGKTPGSWIRPVSARPSAEVSEEERRYEDGKDPRLLDIIEVPMLAPAPVLQQSENHVLDAGYYWVKKGELGFDQLAKMVDQPGTLWANGDSTYNGLNDRMTVEVAAKQKESLLLIKPESLTINVQTEGAAFGNPRRRVRATFKYNGVNYILAVTDPAIEREYLGKANGDYKVGNAFLCVSLGEAHTDGHCYKLVAAIITK